MPAPIPFPIAVRQAALKLRFTFAQPASIPREQPARPELAPRPVGHLPFLGTLVQHA